jgi:F0F1-type ATP synthase alpha subunit
MKVTMQIIVNYLDLKRSESWNELNNELNEEEFPLVESDRKVMDLLVQISDNKVAAVIETQQYLIRRAMEKVFTSHIQVKPGEFVKLL